jgi:hypothetical protein
MAYLALDRFRYSKTILIMLCTAKTEVDKRLHDLGITNDTILARIGRHISNVREGLSIRLVYKCGPKMFGAADWSGWDVWLVRTFLLFLFLSLLGATYYYKYDGNNIYWAIYILSCAGIIMPVIFVIIGTLYIRYYKSKINTIKNDLKVFGEDYKLKINEMDKEVK